MLLAAVVDSSASPKPSDRCRRSTCSAARERLLRWQRLQMVPRGGRVSTHQFSLLDCLVKSNSGNLEVVAGATTGTSVSLGYIMIGEGGAGKLQPPSRLPPMETHWYSEPTAQLPQYRLSLVPAWRTARFGSAILSPALSAASPAALTVPLDGVAWRPWRHRPSRRQLRRRQRRSHRQRPQRHRRRRRPRQRRHRLPKRRYRTRRPGSFPSRRRG